MKPTTALACGVALAAASACTGGSGHVSTATLQRAQQTIDYAEHLADRAPRIPGEVRLKGAPPENLERPNETIGVGDLVVRARYWTVPGSADHAYRALKRTAVDGLQLSGFGLPSRSADSSPGRGFLNYQILDLPDFLQGGELYVEMEPAETGGTVIAAFGEVFAHPVRSADEHISPVGATATARWPKLDGSTPLAKVTTHPLHVLSPSEVRTVIVGFNRSPVAAPVTCMGGIRPVGDELTVTIRSNGHLWRLEYPGGPCLGLGVTEDGVPLPALAPDPAFRRVLAVLAHDEGTVEGRLLMVGGPAGHAPTGLTGRLTLSADGQVVSTVTTRSHGGFFLLSAQPGRYALTGTSTHYRVNGRPGTCRASHPVVVHTNEKTHANVYCQIK